MPFSNPYSLVIGSDTFSLKRVNQDDFGATYLHIGDGFEVAMKVRHSYESKKPGQTQVTRSNVDITKTTFASDGTTTTHQIYMVSRNPRGTSPLVVAEFVAALGALCTADSSSIANRDLY